MTFTALPRELQIEILRYVSPPSWPNALAQFVCLAEQDFERPGSTYDVWTSFRIHDMETPRCMNEVWEDWFLYVSVLLEDLQGELTFTLKVHAVKRFCHLPERLDFVVDFERTWIDREKFLLDASDLSQFVPRQIKRLPKLACRIGMLKYDKCAYFLSIPRSPYAHLAEFARCSWRGARHFLECLR